ncbi:peptidyl-tRNA hydrolase [Candidatus Magnetobacterium bavaricum]|uniref:Peptidyl-tRNA hydrolase n=1 Tax=Candidatus Magnetobacterium bavaricum TaxID=29290 RepID=A0A0F3GV79_9BACT|nr:peptidyl-tRNA hydrolase [Candidatus Magnetobacterium bavaricum]
MWVIAGLGNPGTRYRHTRHNVGFMVIDNLAARYGIKLKSGRVSDGGNGVIEGREVLLIKPLTYMNLSGTAIRDVMKYNADTTVVVHDDIDMDTGRLKLKRGGSSGGHKGIQSIIDCTGYRDFLRIKLGVGRDHSVAVEEYVLSGFSRAEATVIEEVIQRAVDALACVVVEGIDSCMNRFNGKCN